jgi:two-component system phosphate regulon sensor histidine kinase PhoR
VDVRDSRAQGGTGLGLALVKHILNRHHGRLSIESIPGAGATFTVFLPMVAAVTIEKTALDQCDDLSSNRHARLIER